VTTAPVEAGSPRVLVVDDDADTIATTALLFQHQGYHVHTARAGAEALQQAKESIPSLVFLDLAMPGMDGFEVARRLQEIPELADSALVAVTGYGRPIDRLHCAEAGFDLCLTKPVDFGVLEQTTWLVGQSAALGEESLKLLLQQEAAIRSFVKAAIDMANTFLNVALSDRPSPVQERCLAKAFKTHDRISRLTQKLKLDKELADALDDLQRRYNAVRG
jgi:CheY-like chemotaxis protein